MILVERERERERERSVWCVAMWEIGGHVKDWMANFNNLPPRRLVGNFFLPDLAARGNKLNEFSIHSQFFFNN